jgi:hypothetical protein
MSILTSLLLLVAGLTLFILLLRSRPKSRIRRLEAWEQERLEIAANICHAAARDAFDLSLDGSIASLETVDHMIEQGWPMPAVPDRAEAAEEELQTSEKDAQAIGEDAETSEEDAQAREEPMPDSSESVSQATAIPDEHFVIGCYLGMVIVTHLDGEWRTDTELHKWPYVYFSRADLAVSPFELVQKKFEEPLEFMLADAAERLAADIDRRTNVRATTWHNAGEDRVSFGEPTEHTE